jgi:hypothetical protein
MTLTPAYDQKQQERKMDALKLCGANRGPHDYIPVAWSQTETTKHVTLLMCRVCFTRVAMNTLWDNFSEARI